MSKTLSWILFTALFLSMFGLFQFEAESRRQRRALEARVEQLRLKISTFIDTTEQSGDKTALSSVTASHEKLEGQMNRDKKNVTELLELIVNKNEKLSRELEQLKEEVGKLREQLGYK